MRIEQDDKNDCLERVPVDMWLDGPGGHVDHQFVCSKCGGMEFNVWGGVHFTAIACVVCKTHVGVHYG